MRNLIAVFKKQCKDTFKNKTVFIQFILFPALTLLMNQTVKIEGMPKNFFVNLFATMYIGMAPLTCMAAVVAEEKENNTLRVLLLSNVKPHEFLGGVGSYIWLLCMLGAAVICAAGNYGLRTGLVFMAVTAVGILASLLIGAAIGTFSRTQMMATSIALPVMMFFSFLPMLSMFNETVAGIARFTYSEQIGKMLGQVPSLRLGMDSAGIVAVNMLVFAVLFAAAYQKCGLE